VISVLFAGHMIDSSERKEIGTSGGTYMIDKPSIIITSGGRTGTVFFAELFNDILDSCKVVHEPENLDLRSPLENLWKIKKFGIWNSVVKKMFGKWGITSISNRRMSGDLNIKMAAELLLKEREQFIQSFSEDIYVEASYHYYGLIDILPKVFKKHRVVYIVRDGKEWVRSHMDKKEFYHTKNPHTIFSTRISPKIIGDKKYESKWALMSRFEKLCWAWVTINKYALKTITENPNAKLFYFEDIFKSEDRYDNLKALVDFVTSFPDCSKVTYESLGCKLERKVNQDISYEFPSWKNWSPEYVKQFKMICGPLMSRLGYGSEKEWN